MIGKATSYRFVIVVFALPISASVVTTGCNTTTPETNLERNKNLVRHMNHQVWNKGDLDMIGELYAPDFVRHFLPDGSQLRGINSLRARVRDHREAFPDWQEEIQHIVAEGDLVVLHFVSTGTNKGSWLGNPATGRNIRIHEVSIFRIEDGRIAEQWLMPDIFSMQQQLARANNE